MCFRIHCFPTKNQRFLRESKNFDFILDAVWPKIRFLSGLESHFCVFCSLLNLKGYDTNCSMKKCISLEKYGKHILETRLRFRKFWSFKRLNCSRFSFEWFFENTFTSQVQCKENNRKKSPYRFNAGFSTQSWV